MPTRRLSTVFDELRQSILRRDGAGLTDGRLLEAFINQNDEAAFEALVRRHSKMVWGVCRRVLRNHQDVEDAFQSVFLVLIRKARSIKPREMVGNWLYGVAHQTALKARAMAIRRKSRESQAVPRQEESPNDLRSLLDQELKCLPDKYRAVILLCDLENLTRKEAARQLGCPEGTIAGRLARARTMLAKRLKRHGLMVAGGTLAGAIAQASASASVPISVISSTIKVAQAVLAGTAASGLISSSVAALMKGVMTAMYLTKLKTFTTVLLTAGVVALGGSWVGYRTVAGQQGQLPAESTISPNTKSPSKIKGDSLKTSRERLQGTWRVVQMILIDGRQTLTKDIVWTINGDKVVMAPGFGFGKPSEGLQEATFQLGADKFDTKPAPDGFNLTIPGNRAMRGILIWDEKKLASDKERFRICFQADFWARPNETRHNQKGFMTFVLEREKDADVTSLDRERLQGDWIIVASEKDGENDDPEDLRKVLKGFEGFNPEGLDKVIFDGDRFVMPEGLQEISFKLDAAQSPKRITLIVTKKDGMEGKCNGIYALEGDDLKLCFGAHWDDARPPSNFEAKKGSDLGLMILKRWRPENKETRKGNSGKGTVKAGQPQFAGNADPVRIDPKTQKRAQARKNGEESKAVIDDGDVFKELELKKPTPTMMPRAPATYEYRFEVTEVRQDGEKKLCAPKFKYIEGQYVTFFDGETVSNLKGEFISLEGIGCTAGVSKLKDGRLRLDLRVERFEKKEAANTDLRVIGTSQRLIKIVSLEEKVSLELEGIGKKDVRIRLTLVVSSN